MKTLIIFGTRPEAIKLAPLVRALRADPAFEVVVCVSAQHRQMLDQVLAFFEIEPDYDLDLMTPGQTLPQLTARALTGLAEVFAQVEPDLAIVQGDTTTSFVGGLAAFYAQVPVAHVEAGLRTGDKRAPFPEEINRVLIGHLADLHFAPTPRAVENLRREGLERDVFMVGNTGVDALLSGLKIIESRPQDAIVQHFEAIDLERRIVLVTGHRRENFGAPFRRLCEAFRKLAADFPETQFVYPVHLNPNVQAPVREILGAAPNFTLIDPLSYPHMIWLMNRCHLIITDSGGIQEEAPSLGKPILVTRDVTERQEGVEAGAAVLVGSDFDLIVDTATGLLTDEARYLAMATPENPYGSGDACEKIRRILRERC